VQTTTSNGKVPCLAAALRWGADARARTIAAASMASLVLTGASTIALNNHRAYTLGWVLAAVAAALLLWILPLGVSPRATLALGLAPLTGICVHLRAIVRVDEGRRVR